MNQRQNLKNHNQHCGTKAHLSIIVSNHNLLFLLKPMFFEALLFITNRSVKATSRKKPTAETKRRHFNLLKRRSVVMKNFALSCKGQVIAGEIIRKRSQSYISFNRNSTRPKTLYQSFSKLTGYVKLKANFNFVIFCCVYFRLYRLTNTFLDCDWMYDLR